jgi:hypothetical protein
MGSIEELQRLLANSNALLESKTNETVRLLEALQVANASVAEERALIKHHIKQAR